MDRNILIKELLYAYYDARKKQKKYYKSTKF